MRIQEGPAFTEVTPSFQTNPLRANTPTWQKFEHIGSDVGWRWDAGQDWLDDYTYYAEVVSDAGDDWWGTGMTAPSDGDADVPQPKVYRSYVQSGSTLLQFEQCGQVSLQNCCLASPCGRAPRRCCTRRAPAARMGRV